MVFTYSAFYDWTCKDVNGEDKKEKKTLQTECLLERKEENWWLWIVVFEKRNFSFDVE